MSATGQERPTRTYGSDRLLAEIRSGIIVVGAGQEPTYGAVLGGAAALLGGRNWRVQELRHRQAVGAGCAWRGAGPGSRAWCGTVGLPGVPPLSRPRQPATGSRL